MEASSSSSGSAFTGHKYNSGYDSTSGLNQQRHYKAGNCGKKKKSCNKTNKKKKNDGSIKSAFAK